MLILLPPSEGKTAPRRGAATDLARLASPALTIQAWVNFRTNPTNRMVFYFNNGPGGALSFSVFTNRTGRTFMLDP